MHDEGISRRRFIGGAVVVTAAAAAVPALSNIGVAAANPGAISALVPGDVNWVPLNPTVLARKGYEIYKGKWAGQSACCEATYWPILGAVAAIYPSTFGQVPMGLFNYGGGGVNSWGSICGAPNGGSALLKLLTGNSNAMDDYLQWYQATALPTYAAYLDYKSGTWTPGGSATGGWGTASNQLAIPIANTPKSKANSILCHASLQNWRAAGGNYEASVYPNGQSDRCGKLVYDCVYKLATMVNAWMATGAAAFTGVLDPSAAMPGSSNYSASSSCMTSGCHGTNATTGHPYVNAKMKCTECHTQRVGDNHNL